MEIVQIGQSSRQGKDTFANYFIESAENYGKKCIRLAYADELKNIVADKLGVTIEQLEFMKNNDSTTRDVLIDTATEIREKDPDFFVRFVNDKIRWAGIENFDYVVITDLRFPIEWIKDAYHVQVTRKGVDLKSKNDNLIGQALWDFYITNDKTLQDLAGKAHSTFKQIERLK